MLLVVLGGVAHWSGSIVHDRLLNEDFYSATLVEQRVYRRVYSEVLVDPQLRAATNRMLGSLTIDPSRVAAVTAVSTAVLRLAIPPSALRSATEAALERVLAYVRGDVDVLDATIDLRAALRGLDESAEILLAEVLSSLPQLSATTIEEYRSQVAGFVGAVERGEIPASVPGVVAAGLSDSDIIAIIEDALRYALPERAVDQVAAAVRSGDDAGAVIAASATLLAAHVRAVRNDPLLASTLEIDLLDVLGPYAGQRQQVVIDQIERLRHASGWLPHWLELTALALMVTGLAIIIVCSRGVSAASCWAASAMLASAIATWLVATLASRWWRSPLERAAVRSPSNTLPSAVIEIASDVDGAIGAALQRSADARIVAFVMLAVAAITPAVAISVIARVRATRTRTVLAACAIVAVVASAAAWWQLAPRTQASTRECNGHVELCGRTYDTVVQAATHNSMSSPDVVHVWPEHDGDITAQLDAGIRTLLIDTHYWTATDRPAQLDSVEQTLSPGLAAYLYDHLDDRLNARPGTYVCHARCAFGAAPLALTLRKVKQFLVANPDEVVTLIIQDEISVADTATAFRESGLDPYLYRGDPTDGWPTLGELIESGERVVVFAENSGPPPDWYRPAFDYIQDSDYRVSSPTEFSCGIERGNDGAPLFLLNHWVHRAAPDRADAAVVNQAPFIVARAAECARLRGRLPTFIAVNFFSIGDVTAAVDQLNEVDVSAG